MPHDFEFYETPGPCARWLFDRVPIVGRCFEPCVGDGAIIRASMDMPGARRWVTNDLDPRWPADNHGDATTDAVFVQAQRAGPIDWVISNTAFSIWRDVAEHGLRHAQIGVALYLRLSAHEVLKTGVGRTWWREHPPAGILHLPRFAHQRSLKTGEWASDNVAACWVVWQHGASQQFIDYAPEWVIDQMKAETPEYRARMDRLMAARGVPAGETGRELTGSEAADALAHALETIRRPA